MTSDLLVHVSIITPSAGLVTMAIVLTAVGLPVDDIRLIGSYIITPSAGLVTMAIVLTAVGLPVDDIRLIGSCQYNYTIRWSCYHGNCSDSSWTSG